MFDDDLPQLSHSQQQKAVEQIQELMAQGTSTAQAIKIVSQQIRAAHAAAQTAEEDK